MEAVVVVGGLASSAQLIAYVVQTSFFLSDLYNRLKDAPDRIREYTNNITRLIEIIAHIQEKLSFHTTLVFAQLKHIIAQACNLRDLLIKVLGQYTQPSIRRRYWKLLKGKKEREILLALKNLEREKSNLALCLAAQAEIPIEVRREARKAQPNMPPLGSPKLDEAQTLGYQQYPPSPAITVTDPERAESNEMPDMEGMGSNDKATIDADKSDATRDQKKKAAVLPNVDIHVQEITSSNQARQNNGVYTAGPFMGRIRVQKTHAKDASIQNNGIVGFESFWLMGQTDEDSSS